QNAATFKGGGFQQARIHLSVLAAMFGIAATYDAPVRWKREAPALRDLVARAGFNCKVGTDASYKEAKARAEDLENLVRGNPAQLPAPAAESGWRRGAARPPLMKRLEQAHQEALLPWTASSGEFARHAEALAHEAQIVAALAAVITREGY